MDENIKRHEGWVIEFRPHLTWVTERPMVPGAWWIRVPGEVDDVARFDQDDINHWDAKLWAGCMFAGPLPKPPEPMTEGGDG